MITEEEKYTRLAMKIGTIMDKTTICEEWEEQIQEHKCNDYNQAWKVIHKRLWVNIYNLSSTMISLRRNKYNKQWKNPRGWIIKIHMHTFKASVNVMFNNMHATKRIKFFYERSI